MSAAACVCAAAASLCAPAVSAQQGGGRAALAEKLNAEGSDALARGDAESARAAFERALASDPANVSAHTYLGVMADRAGDLKEAEKHFAAAAVAAPLLASARNNYGAVLMRVGRTELAAKQFEVSLKLDPDQPSALVNLAQIRFASGSDEDLRAARELFARAMRVGRTELAAKQFEVSLKLDPDQPSALVNLAQIRFASGSDEDMRAARELFARAMRVAPDADIARSLVVISLRLGEKEQAASAFRDYAALASSGQPASSSSASARAELGSALLAAGLADEAVAELEAAVALDPSNVGAVVALGRAHLRRKDIRAAGRTLEGALARGLDAAPVYAALADVYEAGGYVENAIPAMRLAIARDPSNELYHVRYGMLLTDTKAPAAAVIRLREALAEFPRSSRLWLALGIAELNDGKSEDAEKSFARSLELDPRSVPALAYLGTVRAERGLYAEAVAFYERAVAAGPELAVPYYLAADALLKQTVVDEPRAMKYLRRAIELEPDFASAHLALARLHVRAERWAEAAAEFEQVVRLDPDLAEAHYQLGRVYTRLKRTAEASAALAKFKELSEAQKEKKESDRRELVRRLANVRF
jgi:tetratricopeptide (TPR) repeat protein